MLDTILFDLDGTLAPFNEKEFVECYFSGVVKKLHHLGVDGELIIKGIWGGTKAMQQNDGTRTNADAFWAFFEPFVGLSRSVMEPIMADFYSNEFDKVKCVMKEQRDCAPMIKGLKAKGYTVALATNPIFPLNGVETRLSWVGLHVEDFATVTSYETSCAAKPSTLYYQDVLDRLGKKPQQCLMVGNNTAEDGAVLQMGIPVVLVTDTPEGPAEAPKGAMTMSFAQLQQYLDELPTVK